MSTLAVTHAVETFPRLCLQARLTANETAKGLRLMWRRRAMLVTALVANGILYVGITSSAGAASSSH